MNRENKKQANSSNETTNCTQKQYSYTSQKRKRELDAEAQDKPTNKMLKRGQPKTLFRPWCDNQTADLMEKSFKINKKSDTKISKAQSSIAPTPSTPYQMAVSQQQLQIAYALQMAYYERQYVMNYFWMQQPPMYQRQMMNYQQQQMQQQLFVFGQQRGCK